MPKKTLAVQLEEALAYIKTLEGAIEDKGVTTIRAQQLAINELSDTCDKLAQDKAMLQEELRLLKAAPVSAASPFRPAVASRATLLSEAQKAQRRELAMQVAQKLGTSVAIPNLPFPEQIAYLEQQLSA